ncbi:MAG: hypothetical protein EOM50_09895 [Erysipelotrichia bacterium]|nr:hypothetical protein [Erysipelotrichia bacterium]
MKSSGIDFLIEESKRKASDLFTDREEPRKVFWKHFDDHSQYLCDRAKGKEATNKSSNAILYYGVGGIGKTRLLKKLKQELFNLRSAANDKVVFELYFSNSGKVYANEAETDLLTLLSLVPLGFQYNVTMQSTANNSIAYQNFYKFCTHANSNSYNFKCQ